MRGRAGERARVGKLRVEREKILTRRADEFICRRRFYDGQLRKLKEWNMQRLLGYEWKMLLFRLDAGLVSFVNIEKDIGI